MAENNEKPQFLKGNYQAPKIESKPDAKATDEMNGFEKAAMERLGGSIAFVMKSKTFMWTEEGEEPKK